MSTHNDLLRSILDLAKVVTPLIGAPAAQPYLAAGKAVLELIEKTKHIFSPADRASIEVTRVELDEVITRVNAHADQTIASLGDRPS